MKSEPVANDNEIAEGIDSRFLISDLCDLVGSYMDEEQVQEVYQAYLFGAQAHEGQVRQSGEPYIYHPLAVARILASMHMDVKSIVACILHDVLEDTPATRIVPWSPNSTQTTYSGRKNVCPCLESTPHATS